MTVPIEDATEDEIKAAEKESTTLTRLLSRANDPFAQNRLRIFYNPKLCRARDAMMV